MDWLTFITEIVKATAWPAVVLVVIVLLRKPLRGLLPYLTRFKYKDFEVTFGREAAEARAEATQLPSPEGLAPAALPPISTEVARLISVSPRAAVIEAWREVDTAARLALIRREAMQPQLMTTSPSKIATLLASYHIFEPRQVALFHDLRTMRNEAAHAPEFALPEFAARDYAEAAARLVELLTSA